MIIIVAVLAAMVLIIVITISMYYVVTSKKPEDKKVKYLHEIYEILELCKVESETGNVSDKIDRIIDTLRYSDINSSGKAKKIELQLHGKASELLENLKNKKQRIEIDNNLKELLRLVKEREVITKYHKNKGGEHYGF